MQNTSRVQIYQFLILFCMIVFGKYSFSEDLCFEKQIFVYDNLQLGKEFTVTVSIENKSNKDIKEYTFETSCGCVKIKELPLILPSKSISKIFLSGIEKKLLKREIELFLKYNNVYQKATLELVFLPPKGITLEPLFHYFGIKTSYLDITPFVFLVKYIPEEDEKNYRVYLNYNHKYLVVNTEEYKEKEIYKWRFNVYFTANCIPRKYDEKICGYIYSKEKIVDKFVFEIKGEIVNSQMYRELPLIISEQQTEIKIEYPLKNIIKIDTSSNIFNYFLQGVGDNLTLLSFNRIPTTEDEYIIVLLKDSNFPFIYYYRDEKYYGDMPFNISFNSESKAIDIYNKLKIPFDIIIDNEKNVLIKDETNGKKLILLDYNPESSLILLFKIKTDYKRYEIKYLICKNKGSIISFQ